MLSKESVRPLIRAAAANSLVQYPALAAGRAGLLPEKIWKRLPVERSFRVSIGEGAAFWYLSSANDAIGRSLYWKGISRGWERETLAVYQALARKARLVLDIGANTGVYTLLAAATNNAARVIAFEPVPRIYDRLVDQIALNGLGHRCEVRNEAVSNVDGIGQFHIPAGDFPTSASLNQQGFRGLAGMVVDVPVRSVDSVLGPTDVVDLVKIDVEGFEDKVLEGMKQTLDASMPSIIVECNPDGPYLKVEEILKSHAYQLFHLTPGGPVAVDRIVPDGSEKCRNYLAQPRDFHEVG